jgi:hypothetical protein
MKSSATVAIVATEYQNFDTVMSTNAAWTTFPWLCLKRLLEKMAMWHPVRCDQPVVLLYDV